MESQNNGRGNAPTRHFMSPGKTSSDRMDILLSCWPKWSHGLAPSHTGSCQGYWLLSKNLPVRPIAEDKSYLCQQTLRCKDGDHVGASPLLTSIPGARVHFACYQRRKVIITKVPSLTKKPFVIDTYYQIEKPFFHGVPLCISAIHI